MLLLQEFGQWMARLDDQRADHLIKCLRRNKKKKEGMLKLRMETNSAEWKCPICRCENKVVYWNDRKQVPSAKCRCCGSSKQKADDMQTTRVIDPMKPNVDEKIVKEWDELIKDIEQNPNDNKCDVGGSLIVDSCPELQKLFFIMKYYHIFMGKKVVGMDDAEEYRIDSIGDLVDNLQGLSLTALIDIFEHVATVHRDEAIFEYFAEGIGKCQAEADCDIMQSIYCRLGSQRSRYEVEENKVDAAERYRLSHFAKWHSFLFHRKCEYTEEETQEIPRTQSLSRSVSQKYDDYGFGVWIDYTAQSPFFDSLKEEVIGNEIHQMTQDQWQDTLMEAQKHLESDKIIVERQYTAKRTDERYGIEKGQDIGIENIIAILVYCNYTDLQARFNETFRKMLVDDTDEMIAERHCRNYYWLGRYALF